MAIERNTLQMLWIVFLGSIVIYAVVSWIVPLTPGLGDPDRVLADWFTDPIIVILHLIGLSAVAAGIGLPPLLIRQWRAAKNTTVADPPPPAFETSREVRQALIIRWAIYEVPAVLGLACAFLSGYWQLFIPLGLLSFVALFFSSPSDELLRRLDESAS